MENEFTTKEEGKAFLEQYALENNFKLLNKGFDMKKKITIPKIYFN
jgi:hypothetical protein